MGYELPFYLETQIVKGAKLIEKSGVIKKYEYKPIYSRRIVKNYTYDNDDCSNASIMQIPYGAGLDDDPNERFRTMTGAGEIMMPFDFSTAFEEGGYEEIIFYDIEGNTVKYCLNIESTTSSSGKVTYRLYAERYLNEERTDRISVTSNSTGEFNYLFYVHCTYSDFDPVTKLQYCAPRVNLSNGTTTKSMTAPGNVRSETNGKSFSDKLDFLITQNEEVQNVDAI